MSVPRPLDQHPTDQLPTNRHSSDRHPTDRHPGDRHPHRPDPTRPAAPGPDGRPSPGEIVAAAVGSDGAGDPSTSLTGLAGSVEYVHRSWPADPRQLSTIRRELLGWLAPLGLSADQTDDVVLAVDEAVANAVRHAYPDDRDGDVELTLWTEGGALCIEITDHGSWRPGQDGTVVGDSRGGRGLLLMQQMVETVLVHFDGRGSRVLLRHRLDSEPRVPDGSGRHARPE